MEHGKQIDSQQLLTDLLAKADIGKLSGDLHDRVHEFIAEVGGCAFCGRPAALLCDHILGFEIHGWGDTTRESAFKAGRLDEYVEGKGLPYPSGDEPVMFTCDAPMCEVCATNKGAIFFPPSLGGPQTQDYCPAHAGDDGSIPRKVMITHEEADRRRKLAWQFGVINKPESNE